MLSRVSHTFPPTGSCCHADRGRCHPPDSRLTQLTRPGLWRGGAVLTLAAGGRCGVRGCNTAVRPDTLASKATSRSRANPRRSPARSQPQRSSGSGHDSVRRGPSGAALIRLLTAVEAPGGNSLTRPSEHAPAGTFAQSDPAERQYSSYKPKLRS